ncbi:MAG TPA: RluA family pseudouridine synthase [Longimicrobium sp.]|nr:RluA family pseudouridine synthase [Longimicrobium sp.]
MSDGQRWVKHTATEEEAGRTVQEVVIGALGISRRMIQKLTRGRAIQLNRRPAFLGAKVKAGDVVSVRLGHEEEPGLEPVAMELAVVHEDAEVLVIDKPPFLLVHPTSPEQDATLAHGVAHHFRETGVHAKVRPVHRIDRDTSGLVLFAKSAFAHQHLDRQLREREVTREYRALVHGVVADDEGVVDAPIGRDKRNPNLRAVRPGAGGEPARTRFRVERRLAGATLLRLELETGRTHQIRVHMAHLGHPVIGDRQYGGRSLGGLRRQALHASSLAFAHPVSGERMSFESPLPPDLAAVAEALGPPDGR